MRYLRLTASLAIIYASINLSAAPLGTAFTFQGRLSDGPNPANGIYHFMFELFDAPTAGTLLNDNEREDVTVSNGVFTVVLDFGATAFTGNARWLQTKVQTNNGGGFTILSPRQQIFPAPYALMAASVPRFLTLGAPDSAGQLSIYSENAPLAIRLEGDPPGIRMFGSDGLENLRVSGPFNGGEILLFDNLTNDMTVRLSAGGALAFESGGLLELFSSSVLFNPSSVRARLTSDLNGGNLDLFGGGQRTARLNGTLGTLSLGPPNNANLTLGAGFGDSSLVLNSFDGVQRVLLQSRILAGHSGNLGFGELRLFDHVGTNNTVTLSATTNSGGLLELHTATGGRAISADGGFGRITLFRANDGVEALRLFNFGGGNLTVNNDPHGDNTAWLSAGGNGGAFLRLNSSNAQQRAFLSGANFGGFLTLNQSTGARNITLSNHLVSTFGSDGLEQVRLGGASSGELLLNNSLPGNQTAVALSARGSAGGLLTLNNSSGQQRAQLSGDNAGGSLELNNATGALSVDLRSQFTAGNTAAWMGLNDNGSQRITFAARNGSTGTGGLIGVFNGGGVATVLVTGDNGSGHSKISVLNGSGVETIQLHASYPNNGKGRLVTPVLEITAGADLSEQFDVTFAGSEVQPGMVVCIDPQNQGKLVMSTKPYDRTVAGIVSGAGGVSPGMLMGQQGSLADGKHPIALTGRVYCLADASHGAIQPGDLLTSSDSPGHSMKVADHAKAQGAIIGKAMTRLEAGKGLVLVLVSLQ